MNWVMMRFRQTYKRGIIQLGIRLERRRMSFSHAQHRTTTATWCYIFWSAMKVQPGLCEGGQRLESCRKCIAVGVPCNVASATLASGAPLCLVCLLLAFLRTATPVEIEPQVTAGVMKEHIILKVGNWIAHLHLEARVSAASL